MRILHLTDFHYSSNERKKIDQKSLVSALLSDLSTHKSKPIDLIFFTGDLVFSGENPSDFIDAKNELLAELVKKTGVPKGRIFICAGNHDIFRNQELIDTTDKIREITENAQLEEFLKRQNGKSFEESLKNSENYNSFQRDFYSDQGDTVTEIKNLYTTHTLELDNCKIGILAINSAWRAIDSETDRGNLLFPISLLKEGVNTVSKNSEFRIALMHHPVSDFKDWNASDIEDIIHKEFQMLFSGHLHKKKQSLQICTDEGIFCCSSAATLSLDNAQNGYSLIDIDPITFDIEISNAYYNRADNIFLHPSESISTAIPTGDSKRASIDFRKTLRKRYLEELDRANELFISYDDEAKGKGFVELFTDPILKKKTKAQIAESKSDTSNIILSDTISKPDNVVVFGKDKSGKTSILYKAFLDLLVDFSLHKTIPVYIDAREYRSSAKPVDLYKHISHYYEMNINKAKTLSDQYHVKLLIDNYEPSQTEFNSKINLFLEAHKNVSFIAATEEKLDASFSSYEFDGRTYSNLYIHEISRPEVRMLANKWPNLTPEKRELILEKIFTIFAQLNIPTNYWTVSLFIWIFEKNNDTNFHSSFELIQLYVDNLLDRKRLALDKSSKLKFEEFKNYLGALSHFLIYDREDKGYAATYTEIVTFTNGYREKNMRFVIEVKDVVNLIIEKNILRKVYEDYYTFRLNGVFEYFLALHMTNDQNFRESIIRNDHYYLSFKNELELYAGFERNGENYLNTIYERTKSIFKNLHETYSKTDIDTQLLQKISEVFDVTLPISKLGNQYKKALPPEKQDEILSELQPSDLNKSEVKVKDYYENIEETSENLEQALHILARVYRNSTTQNDKQVNEILDYILDSACYLGFKLIDEAEKEYGEEYSEDDEKIMVQLITNFMPIIVQTFLFDAIGQNDLERIFQEKIKVLKVNAKQNQFKLLLLYFTLIDLDLNSHKNLIEELIDTIKLGILRQTSIIKLYAYLLFKCANKPSLEKFINDQIQSLTLIINPEVDKGELQKGLAKNSTLIRLRNSKGHKN